MKISNKNCVQFETIGTIFAYQERQFYPELETYTLSVKDKKDLLIQAENSEEKIYLPSNHVSDLSDISLYDFKFDLIGDKKYIPNFYPGILDDYSQKIVKNGIDIYSNYMVPQVSPSKDHTGPTYFGGFQDKEGNYIKLIKVPAGYWKLEIYNEPRINWNTFYEDDYRIIDSDLIQIIEDSEKESPSKTITLHYTPCLKIYFGPMYDTKLEGQSYESAITNEIYGSRYYCLSTGGAGDAILANHYNNYKNVMTELEYVESYKEEIMSEKIVYLSYTSQGEIKEIKLVETSFNHHKNPGRNQNKLSMRMDDFLAHDFSPIDDHGNIAIDKPSGVILGTREDKISINNKEESGFSFFNLRKNELAPSLRSTNIKKVNLDGKKFINGNQEKLFQNPIVSPDWFINEKAESDYFKCRISHTTGGKIYRKNQDKEELIEGVRFLKRNSILILKPVEELGYKLKSIEPSSYLENEGDYIYMTIPSSIVFKFEHKVYIFRVKLLCNKDYFLSKGTKIEFDTNSYYTSFVRDRGIRLLIGTEDSEFKEYNPDVNGILEVDETSEISFKLYYGDYYYPTNFNSDKIFKVSLKDLEIIEDTYADYEIEISVVNPEVSLYGDVDFGKTRHFKVNFNGYVKIEFYSEDEVWDNPEEAVNHIHIKRGNDDPKTPTVDSAVYDPGEDGFRYLTISQIKTKSVEINIWTKQ